jgi:hypothetical protein
MPPQNVWFSTYLNILERTKCSARRTCVWFKISWSTSATTTVQGSGSTGSVWLDPLIGEAQRDALLIRERIAGMTVGSRAA